MTLAASTRTNIKALGRTSSRTLKTHISIIDLSYYYVELFTASLSVLVYRTEYNAQERGWRNEWRSLYYEQIRYQGA